MRTVVSIGFAVALVRWSAGMVFAAPRPFVMPQAAQPGVLYSFHNRLDGAYPEGALSDRNGVL